MTQIIALAATARDRAGKGTARAVRREGQIPAVIYGNKEKPVMISLDYSKFHRELHRPGFFTHLFDVTVDGATHRVLPRDVQLDPVYDRPLHVDFLRVSDTTEITLKVPVEFVNVETCPGIKKGGVLNVVRHDIEVFALAGNLPEKITVDLAGKQIGDSIHINDIILPEGVTAMEKGNFTIVTLAAPSGGDKAAA